MIDIYILLKYNGRYKKCHEEKDTCIIALIMFYETKSNNPIKVYRVLSYVPYSVI